MKIDYPIEDQLPALRRLWKSAFGDTDVYLDLFFENVFSPDRCRCVTLDEDVAAALYWLDCRAYGKPMAYLYAIATEKRHRGKGLCRALMADTHALLKDLGYAGCLLVPEGNSLFEMYAGFGYQVCSSVREFSCTAGETPVPLRLISAEEYAALRRSYLPEGGVIQEGENLTYLQKQTSLYAGEDFLLCAAMEDGKLHCPEILGNTDAAPGILAALGAQSGTFRTVGVEQPFAMYHALSDIPMPTYFGLAFD